MKNLMKSTIENSTLAFQIQGLAQCLVSSMLFLLPVIPQDSNS